MIYEFYNNYSSGPIVNFFNEIGMIGTKLINFKSLEPHEDLRGLEDIETNRFTLGFENEIFYVYIKKDDTILLFTDKLLIPKQFIKTNINTNEIFRQYIVLNNKKTTKVLNDHLIQRCREYKLNSILPRN